MKVQKYFFNKLLRQFNKCKRRLSNLKASNRNVHRQAVLEKHIARISEKLTTLQAYIKRGTVVASLALGAMAFQSNDAKAQTIPTFSASVLNPFGLTNNNEGYTTPTFADLDHDGDLDMLSGQYYGDFVYYENTGTNTNPSFAVGSYNPFGLTATPNYYSAPAFVDIDNDGDMDIVAGDGSSNFYYYENQDNGTGTPSFAAAVTNPFGLQSLGGNYSMPNFADIDNDGDIDLMATDGLNFYYCPNTPVAGVPTFDIATNGQQNPFGITPSSNGIWTSVTFGDIDQDGDFDIMSQSDQGDFQYFENTGTASTPVFGTMVFNPFALNNIKTLTNTQSYVTQFVDLDSDGDLDLMSGDKYGNFLYNKYTPITGAALNFDGADDYVSIPKSVSGDFTIEYWVRTTQTAGTGAWYNGAGMVDAETPGAANDFGTSLVGSKFAFGVGNPDLTITSNADINDGNWHHVAATRVMSTGLMTIYVDGNLETTGNGGTNVLNAPSRITIGSMQTLVSYFNGDIDEVRIWNRALCQGEIMNNMNGELPLPQNGLAAYYKFSEGFAYQNNSSVTTLADSSGNNQNGTLNNFTLNGATSNWIAPGGVISGSLAPVFNYTIAINGTNIISAGASTGLTASPTTADSYTWSTSDNSSFIYVTPNTTTVYTVQAMLNGCLSNIAIDTVFVGNYTGQSLNFDGGNDFAAINTGTTVIQAPYTVETWINTSDYSTSRNILTAISGGSSPVLGLQMVTVPYNMPNKPSEYLTCDLFAGTTYLGGVSSDPNVGLPTNQWIHIALVVGVNHCSLYIDSTLVDSMSINGTAVLLDGVNLDSISVGGSHNASPFMGNMDELRIWNRALCQGEIINNMHGGLQMPQTGLVAYYKFNQGISAGDNQTVTTLADSSGNGLDGTLNNFSLTMSGGAYSNWVAPGAIDSTSYAPAFTIPMLTAPSNTAICAGTALTLTAGGATSYTWSTGSMNDTTIVSPSIETTYTVSGNYYGCGAPQTAVTTVSIIATPIITFNSGNTHTCEGGAAVYNITSNNPNTDTYQWNWVDVTNPAVDSLVRGLYNETGYTSNSMTISPVNSNVWGSSGSWGVHCAVTNTAGCVTKSIIDTIFINPLPTVLAGSTTGVVCAGVEDTLMATGASTYTWSANASSATTASITVFPTGTDTYTVSGADANGCVNTGTVVIAVNLLPNVMASVTKASLCNGASDTLMATGASTYLWSSNASSATTASITVSPTGTDTYTVTGTDANGCVNSGTVVIAVNSLPNVIASVTTASLCIGATDTLMATGASTYIWSANASSATSGSVAISPTSNDTYTVTGTDVNGCSNSSSVTITIITCGTGINQFAGRSISIYPNPSNGYFIIESASGETEEVRMYDVNGRMVFNQTFLGSANIDASKLNNGTYNLSVVSSNGIINKRIVITK